jgi:single-strand DNA-binding protein
MSIANVSIVGNLVRAPEQRQFPSGKIKTTFIVAVDVPSRKKSGGQADFYKVVVWDKFAELVANRLAKGNQVTASGRLVMDQWKDKEGKERVTPTISAYDIAFPPRPRLVEPLAEPDVPTEEAPTEEAPTEEGVSEPSEAGAIEPSPEAAIVAQRRSSDDDDEDSEYNEEDEGSRDDDYGEPDRAIRPAPERERSPRPA